MEGIRVQCDIYSHHHVLLIVVGNFEHTFSFVTGRAVTLTCYICLSHSTK